MWEPPCDPFIKINFDGPFNPYQERSGFEVVARNSLGEILASMTICHKAISSSFVTEAQVAFRTTFNRRRSGEDNGPRNDLERGEFSGKQRIADKRFGRFLFGNCSLPLLSGQSIKCALMMFDGGQWPVD
ncbi:hypothetical protein PVK06_024356 [Gossypium arboreum]|uniref:RNase H type-1 domain-containing protein n=1 Tax=Gossypium arboreum TaxID=29729 RepID=A0ABR0PDW6_GOSAR|nr:hypothetical protein PVK06_024356 [Gossypium arboreum]